MINEHQKPYSDKGGREHERIFGKWVSGKAPRKNLSGPKLKWNPPKSRDKEFINERKLNRKKIREAFRMEAPC